MILAVLSLLVALLLGFGAAQELFVRGIQGGEVQPFVIGLVGLALSLLMAVTGVALWRRWTVARQLAVATGLASILFHVYGALPPHRTMGMFALLLGVGFGLVLLYEGLISKTKSAEVN